jgi:hypothetical protein
MYNVKNIFSHAVEVLVMKKRYVEICALLRQYAASSGNPLPTFRADVSVPSSTVKKMGPIRRPETSVTDYHSTLRRRVQLSSIWAQKPEITDFWNRQNECGRRQHLMSSHV